MPRSPSQHRRFLSEWEESILVSPVDDYGESIIADLLSCTGDPMDC